MHLPDPIAAARRGLAVALLAALISPVASVAAQELLPRVEVRQVGDLRWAWQNEARVKIDRDAFIVVAELGADGRLRIVYPERPGQSAYTSSKRPFFTPLPSSDAMFIRASWVRVPTVIAFASDVAPDLSSFSSDGKTWEFEYNIRESASEQEVVRALASVLYGSPDMPFSIATARSAPVLSASAISTLASCGYALGGDVANDFRSFLWDVYGPMAIGSRRAFFGDYGSDWHRNLFLSTYMPFPFSSFQRGVGSGLWNRFGAGCPALTRQMPMFFVAMNDVRMPPPPDSIGGVQPPKDRDGKPPKEVDDVELVPASPAAIQRRANAVRDAATKVATARGSDGGVTGVAQRSERSELVQRSQVAQAIAMLNARNALGVDGSGSRANVRRGMVRNGVFGGGSSGYGGNGTITRASGSGGGSTGVGTSSGSGSSSSVGSGASSGAGRGGEARGGATGGGRTGTGRP